VKTNVFFLPTLTICIQSTLHHIPASPSSWEREECAKTNEAKGSHNNNWRLQRQLTTTRPAPDSATATEKKTFFAASRRQMRGPIIIPELLLVTSTHIELNSTQLHLDERSFFFSQ